MEISKNVTWKPLGEKIVAVKVDSGEYYTMNEVSSLIWRGINDGKTVDEIAGLISQEYDNDDTDSIKKDIEEQISEWKQELLIL
ncbi:MAG: PqqD family protein [Prevotella sp.]|nr:PqqD family protein [Prevotella sp.]